MNFFLDSSGKFDVGGKVTAKCFAYCVGEKNGVLCLKNGIISSQVSVTP